MYDTLLRRQPNDGQTIIPDLYPGTGPLRHVSRKDREIWVMERNPSY
jgi:hypothetical protein